MTARWETAPWCERVLVVTDCACPPSPLPHGPGFPQTAGADGSVMDWSSTGHDPATDRCPTDGEWALRITGPAGPTIGLVVDYTHCDETFSDLLNTDVDQWDRVGALHRALLDPTTWITPAERSQAERDGHDPLALLPFWVVGGYPTWTQAAPFIAAGIPGPDTVEEWRQVRFTDAEIPAWYALMMNSPHRASTYRRAGFTPTTALAWSVEAPQIAAATAADLHAAGWRPDQAHRAFQNVLHARPRTQFTAPTLDPPLEPRVGDRALMLMAAVRWLSPARAVDAAHAGLTPADLADPAAVDWDTVAAMVALRATAEAAW